MPITPTAIRNRVAAVSFAYGDDTVNLTYHPAACGGEAAAELNRLIREVQAADKAEGDEAEEATAAALLDFGRFACGILASWDYMEDPAEDGTPGGPVPLTPERVGEETRRFGDFVLACLIAAVEDSRAGKRRGAA